MADLLELGAQVQQAFLRAAALVTRPTVVQQRYLTENHRQVVGKRAGIEATGLTLLSQPNLSAQTIRRVACAIEIAAELERITYLLGRLVRTPLLTYEDTADKVSAATRVSIENAATAIDRVLAVLAEAERALPSGAAPTSERVAAQFALAYAWAVDDAGAALARPFLRRQAMSLAQSHREIAACLANLTQWTAFWLQPDGADALPIAPEGHGLSNNPDDKDNEQ